MVKRAITYGMSYWAIRGFFNSQWPAILQSGKYVSLGLIAAHMLGVGSEHYTQVTKRRRGPIEPPKNITHTPSLLECELIAAFPPFAAQIVGMLPPSFFPIGYAIYASAVYYYISRCRQADLDRIASHFVSLGKSKSRVALAIDPEVLADIGDIRAGQRRNYS